MPAGRNFTCKADLPVRAAATRSMSLRLLPAAEVRIFAGDAEWRLLPLSELWLTGFTKGG